MSNDPFKNFKPLNQTPQSQKKKPAAPRGDSFVEQIKSIGSSTVSALKNDVVKGSAQSIFESIVGSSQKQATPPENQQTEVFKNWMADRENQAAEQARQDERLFQNQRHNQEKVLFSFNDEKLKREIDSVRQEIALLVQSMGQVQTQIEQAVIQNVVDPGVYHLNFFRNLKNWIRTMRLSLENASSWLETASNRGKESYYWKQVGKSGTKYSMSSERNVQMGAG